MTVADSTVPNEETPLLGGNQVSAIEGVISEPDSEAATLEGLSNSSRTPSIAKNNATGASEPVKKTPLPWAQFSILLFLQLAEPLTSQVIYPVSSPVSASLTDRSTAP